MAAGSYSFAWRLSGDRRAGPLQVFDNGQTTWLQFAPDQTLPAIFARTAQGDQLLAYRRQGPYAVLDGVWSVLMLRAGTLESRVERIEPDHTGSRTQTGQSGQSDTGVNEPAVTAQANAPSLLSLRPDPAARSLSAEALTQHLVPLGLPAGATMAVPEADAAESYRPPTAPPSGYQVSPQDGNIRLVLSRWARSSGWTFESEHWVVDVDIPIAGTARFELEFDEAVQQLLASTELSDRPLQPCFYANKVLRVVPYAQSCDRTMLRERV